eukprot:238008-Rhodomonas_salina.4
MSDKAAGCQRACCCGKSGSHSVPKGCKGRDLGGWCCTRRLAGAVVSGEKIDLTFTRSMTFRVSDVYLGGDVGPED